MEIILFFLQIIHNTIFPADNPAPIDQAIAKPSINESAALPIASDLNP